MMANADYSQPGLWFVLLIPATFYLVYVLSITDGPYKVLARLRELIPLGGLWICPYCLSPWIAGLLFLLLTFTPFGYFIVVILALAGSAMLLYRFTGGKNL